MSRHATLRRSVAASAVVAVALSTWAMTPSHGLTAEGHGALTVRPSPTVAAQITVGGVARNRSQIVDLALPAGDHEVCVAAVDGYLPPPCEVVSIVEGATTAIAPAYTRSGTLVVTTEPPQSDAVITVGGTVRDIGAVRLPLAVGSHVVCFGDVAGMVTPPCEEVHVAPDETSRSVGVYVAEQAAPEPEPVPEEPASVAVQLSGSAHATRGSAPWSALVTVTLRGHDGRGLAGVTATGTWSTSRPATAVTSSCVTGTDGACTVEATEMATGAGNTATFGLVEVTAPSDLVPRTGHSSITVNRNGSVTVSD